MSFAQDLAVIFKWDQVVQVCTHDKVLKYLYKTFENNVFALLAGQRKPWRGILLYGVSLFSFICKLLEVTMSITGP